MFILISQNNTSPSQNDGMIETSRILSEIGRTYLIVIKSIEEWLHAWWEGVRNFTDFVVEFEVDSKIVLSKVWLWETVVLA